MSDGFPDLNGLVLAGGQSRRMGTDKASLRYGDEASPQWLRMVRLLNQLCPQVFVSIRQGQRLEGYEPASGFRLLEDPAQSKGPLTGFLRAFDTAPGSAWLIVACDLPLLDLQTLQHLVSHRGEHAAVAYRSAHDTLPEPLCAIYEPAMRSVLQTALDNDLRCPRKILINHEESIRLLDLPNKNALENANTPDEFERLSGMMKGVLS